MTTPSPPAASNDTSDIWASDSPPSNSHEHLDQVPASEPSDLPSLRRQHMTTGYREGLSVGKARIMQSAFDQGYPIGVSLALRAGTVIGVLEGLVAPSSVSGDERKGLEALLEQARRELDVSKLMEGVSEEHVAGAEEAKHLGSVEGVVRGWEARVLGSLHERGEEMAEGVTSGSKKRS